MGKNDFNSAKRLAQDSIYEIDQLIDRGLYDVFPYHDRLESTAMLHYAIIRLYDILKLAAEVGRRVTIVNDVELDNEVHDLTDLVKHARNAAAHIDAKARKHQVGSIGLAVVTNAPAAIVMVNCGADGFTGTLGSKFPDDPAILFGTRCLNMKHNFKIAFEAARVIFA